MSDRCACGCRAPVPVRTGAGRPNVYAFPRCRKRAYRLRAKRKRSLSVEWYTPPEVFAEGLELADVEAFDLDPCTSERSPIWPLVRDHYVLTDNGLRRPWFGRIYCNPPYGRTIGLWIAKAIAEVQDGRATVVCMLVPAKTDTAWWHAAIDAGFVATYRRCRIRFLEPQPDGTLARGGAGTFASAWLVFRPAQTGTKSANTNTAPLEREVA